MSSKIYLSSVSNSGVGFQQAYIQCTYDSTYLLAPYPAENQILLNEFDSASNITFDTLNSAINFDIEGVYLVNININCSFQSGGNFRVFPKINGISLFEYTQVFSLDENPSGQSCYAGYSFFISASAGDNITFYATSTSADCTINIDPVNTISRSIRICVNRIGN